MPAKKDTIYHKQHTILGIFGMFIVTWLREGGALVPGCVAERCAVSPYVCGFRDLII